MLTREAAGRLTLDVIVDAAAQLIEERGFEGLSMRKLAERCGVAPMTLYGYVRTKDDIVTLLAERRFSEIEVPDPDAPWDEQVKALFRSVHRIFVEHPELGEIVARRHLNAMSAFKGADAVLGAMRSAGLGAQDCVAAFIALTAYTTGFSQRQAHLDGEAGASGPRLERVQRLPAEEFKHLPELATVFVARLSDEQFENGLDLLVQGIASRVGARR